MIAMIHSVSLMHFDRAPRLGISADVLFFASVCGKGRMRHNSVQYKRWIDHIYGTS